MNITDSALLEKAIEARTFSYSPYSHYEVGAALVGEDGKIYTGCNIENASYGPSNCAERTAFFKAVSEGQRKFTAIAIVGGKSGEPVVDCCPPCGVCRQVMREFCDPDFRVILGTPENPKCYLLKELLPLSFGPEDL